MKLLPHVPTNPNYIYQFSFSSCQPFNTPHTLFPHCNFFLPSSAAKKLHNSSFFMAKPQKPKGCFSSFIRVVLCAGNGTSPPVHPSEHFLESEESENAHFTKEKMVVSDDYNASSTTPPGVVARLMGLDSLPNPKWVVKCGTIDSVPRSRSVNFVDYLLEFDANHDVRHRRVKTSASFREVPTLVHNHKGSSSSNNNSNLFVFCMDGENSMSEGQELRQRKRQGSSKNKESVSVKKKRNQGKKNKKISNLKNEPRRVPSSSCSTATKNSSKGRNHNHGEAKDLSFVSSNSSKCGYCSNRKKGPSSGTRFNTSLPNKHKKGIVEPKVRKNLRKRSQQSVLKVESECSFGNHSPVSVVDSNNYPFLYGADFLDGTSSIASKSKWESPSLLPLGDDDEVEDSASTNETHAFIDDVNKEAEYYSELMLKLCTLTEQDIREMDCTSKCVRESKSFGDICLMFEHKIFDHLLCEVVNEVLELHC